MPGNLSGAAVQSVGLVDAGDAWQGLVLNGSTAAVFEEFPGITQSSTTFNTRMGDRFSIQVTEDGTVAYLQNSIVIYSSSWKPGDAKVQASFQSADSTIRNITWVNLTTVKQQKANEKANEVAMLVKLSVDEVATATEASDDLQQQLDELLAQLNSLLHTTTVLGQRVVVAQQQHQLDMQRKAVLATAVNEQADAAGCPQLESQSECNTACCPKDCEVGEWTKHAQCSRFCGGGGVTSRNRPILIPMSGGGDYCPTTEEELECGTTPCQGDCYRLDDPWCKEQVSNYGVTSDPFALASNDVLISTNGQAAATAIQTKFKSRCALSDCPCGYLPFQNDATKCCQGRCPPGQEETSNIAVCTMAPNDVDLADADRCVKHGAPCQTNPAGRPFVRVKTSTPGTLHVTKMEFFSSKSCVEQEKIGTVHESVVFSTDEGGAAGAIFDSVGNQSAGGVWTSTGAIDEFLGVQLAGCGKPLRAMRLQTSKQFEPPAIIVEDSAHGAEWSRIMRIENISAAKGDGFCFEVLKGTKGAIKMMDQSELCLAVETGEEAAAFGGMPIDLKICDRGVHQKMYMTPEGELMYDADRSLCLGLASGADQGTNVSLVGCSELSRWHTIPEDGSVCWAGPQKDASLPAGSFCMTADRPNQNYLAASAERDSAIAAVDTAQDNVDDLETQLAAADNAATTRTVTTQLESARSILQEAEAAKIKWIRKAEVALHDRDGVLDPRVNRGSAVNVWERTERSSQNWELPVLGELKSGNVISLLSTLQNHSKFLSDRSLQFDGGHDPTEMAFRILLASHDEEVDGVVFKFTAEDKKCRIAYNDTGGTIGDASIDTRAECESSCATNPDCKFLSHNASDSAGEGLCQLYTKCDYYMEGEECTAIPCTVCEPCTGFKVYKKVPAADMVDKLLHFGDHIQLQSVRTDRFVGYSWSRIASATPLLHGSKSATFQLVDPKAQTQQHSFTDPSIAQHAPVFSEETLLLRRVEVPTYYLQNARESPGLLQMSSDGFSDASHFKMIKLNRKVPCEVGSWTSWSDSICSRTCGGGVQQRTREIVRLPENGGAACPKL